MSTVRTLVERSGWEGLVPIERFIPLMEHFAQIFGMPLVAHAPQLRAKPHESSEKEVFIHFFYQSSTGADTEESTLQDVFSHQSSEPLRCWKPHPYSSVDNTFRDFYGNLIAHREGNSIFIDFDFLRDSWEGHEDVLFLTLWFLLPTPYDFSSSNFVTGGHRLAERLRARFSGAKETSKNAFLQWFPSALKEALATYDHKIFNSTQTINSVEITYAQALREIEELEKFLEILPAKIPGDDKLAKEFDELLRLPDIVQVCTLRYADENKGKVRLTTRILEQQIPAPPQKGTRYDIGSFDVDINPFLEINPLTAVAEQIRIAQKEPGPFKKEYMEGRSCLGNKVDRGLNYAAAKALVLLAMVPLAVMCLTFLKYDTKFPTENPNIKPESQKKVTAPPKEMPKEKIDRERTRYVELMRRAWLSRLNKNAGEKLKELKEQTVAKLSKLYQERGHREEFIVFLRFLKERFAGIQTEGLKVFEELSSHPAVAQIEIAGDDLRIWIQNEKIPYPRLLSIGRSGIFRVISLNEFGGKGTHHGIVFSTQQNEDTVRKLIAEGNYPEVLDKILNQMTQPIIYAGGWG